MRQCTCNCPGHHFSEARQGAEGDERDEGCSRQGTHFWVRWVSSGGVWWVGMGQGADGSPWGGGRGRGT